MLHWGQGTMFKALSNLLLQRYVQAATLGTSIG
jgi:hypothetical protein